jgi:pimeloyl-ACP methyl ester carboxylesterase
VLAHERIGEGPPLLLIHGIGHRRQAWYPVVDLLAPHREVILVDLPGHGQSPSWAPRGRPARDYMREQFEAFHADLGLNRPHVAGNSLGGLIALESAVDGRASSVTALSPAGFWKGEQDFAYIERLFRTVVVAAGYSQHIAPILAHTGAGRMLMMSWAMAHPRRLTAEAAIGDLRAMLRARPALHSLLGQAYSFDGDVPADVPVTIAWGKRDHVLRTYQAERARKLMPEATHRWLRGCGHVPMSDRPRLIADVLLKGSSTPLLAAAPLAAEVS